MLDTGPMALVFVYLFVCFLVFFCYFVFIFRVICPVSYFVEINPNISALAASRVLVRDLQYFGMRGVSLGNSVWMFGAKLTVLLGED